MTQQIEELTRLVSVLLLFYFFLKILKIRSPESIVKERELFFVLQWNKLRAKPHIRDRRCYKLISILGAVIAVTR